MRPVTLSRLCYAAAAVSAVSAVALALNLDLVAAFIVWALSVVLLICGQSAGGLYDPKAERERAKADYMRALARNDRRGSGEAAKRFRVATNECLRVGK
jgi:hypothetical protein